MKQSNFHLCIIGRVLQSKVSGKPCRAGNLDGAIREGSAVLLVTLVMGALSLFAISVWRNTIFLHDIVLKKQEYEHNFRSTEAALNMGIALCKKYPKRFFIAKNQDDKAPHKPFIAIISPWLSKKDQRATIQIYPDDKAVLIRAQLSKGEQPTFGLRCVVELAGLKGKKQLIEVKKWAFQADRTGRTQKK